MTEEQWGSAASSHYQNRKIGQQLAWGHKWDIRRERRKEKPNEVHQKCLTSRLPTLHFWLGVQQQRRMTDWRWADCVGGMGKTSALFWKSVCMAFSNRYRGTVSKWKADAVLKGNAWTCSDWPFFFFLHQPRVPVEAHTATLMCGFSPLK